MRQGQQNRRGRGRSNNGSSNNHSNSNNNSNNNNSSNNGRKPQNALSRNYESSGPDVKIRGTAAQIAEKYLTLARDASSSGDIVMAENYLQHAEHYNRIIMAAQVQAATQNPNGGDYGMGMNGHHNHRIQADGITNFGMMRDEPQPMIEQPRQQPQYQAQPQPQHQPQPQPQQQAPLPGMEPQPEVAAAVAPTDTPAADAGEQPASRAAPDADGRRRRRRYPAGSTAASRAAAAASAEPAANGHNGTGNGLDNEGRPSDEAVAN